MENLETATKSRLIFSNQITQRRRLSPAVTHLETPHQLTLTTNKTINITGAQLQ